MVRPFRTTPVYRAHDLRLHWKLPGVCLMLLLWPAAERLCAQSPVGGGIAGRLSAGPGAADVAAVETATGISYHTQASKAGFYLLSPLPPGEYTVEIGVAEGLAAHREHVVVIQDEVTYVGDTASGPASTDAPEAQVPSVGGLSDATSRANPDSDAEGESLPSFRGLPTTQNSVRIDGGEQTQAFGGVSPGAGSPVDRGDAESGDEGDADLGATRRNDSGRPVRGASAPFSFARGSIREFHLSGDTFSALYGSAPGGILTGVTRTGAAHVHGSAFGLVRNSAFAATNPYALATHYHDGAISSGLVKPHDGREQFGGSLGGPVFRRSVFGFAAVDGQRRGFPVISSPQDPNFYALSAMQRALLENRGVGSSATNAALNYLDSLTGAAPRRADGAVEFVRLDWHPAARVALSVEGNRARWNQPVGSLSAPVVSRGRASIGNTADKFDTVLGRGTVRFTSFLADEFRVGYGRELRYESPQVPLAQEPAIAPGGLAPEVAIGPQGFTFGTPANLGRAAYPDERRLQMADLLSLVRGRHHVQGGGELSRINTFVSALTNQQGTFRYDSTAATAGRAGGLVDWITDATFNVNAYPNGGCPSIHAADHLFCFRSYTQSFGEQDVSFKTQQWAAFLQDDWRIARRLTVHAGVRYDYQLLPVPQHPNAALDTVFGAVGSTGVFPEDRNNFAPRAAFSLQATKRLTVRAGYGVFFGRTPGATIRSALLDTDLPASTERIRILPTTETACPQVANQGFGYPCAYLTSPAAALRGATSATVFSRRFRLPMVQQASVTLEAELPGRVRVSGTYRMNLDRQLPSSVDLNIAPSTTAASFQLQGGTGEDGVRDGEMFFLPIYTQRVTATVGPVTAITSSADATYHGITVEGRRSVTDFTMAGSLTLSRAIDFNPTQGAIPRTDAQLDPFNLRYDKAPSALNFPFRLLLNAAWQPHVVSSHRLVRGAANGWSLAPIFVMRSGAPYSLNLFGGGRLSGGSESINRSGGAVYLPTVGRNTRQLPRAMNLDLRLAREVRLSETFRLRASVEGYNVANHVNVSGVSQRAYLAGKPVAGVTPLVFQDAGNIAAEGLRTRPFGSYTDSGTNEARAREVQLGLRLDF